MCGFGRHSPVARVIARFGVAKSIASEVAQGVVAYGLGGCDLVGGHAVTAYGVV
jgi:hypothetical protein